MPVSPLRRLVVASTALVAALVGTFFTPLAVAQTATQPVNIGVIGPFTGPSSDFGQPMLHGIQLAIDEINSVGGYLGRPLTLVIKDDQGNPDQGLKGAEELMQAGVIATIGFCNTGVAMKTLDVFQQAKSPLIVPCATGTPITARFPGPESYIFRTSARDAIQALSWSTTSSSAAGPRFRCSPTQPAMAKPG